MANMEAPLPEPTAEEIKNGWTPELLARYLQERERAAAAVILRRARLEQVKADGSYDPHAW